MTCTLLLSKSLTNLRIFELDVTCPFLAVDAFVDTTSVDTFFTNQAPSLFTPLITNVGTLDVFPSKELLDYFDQHLTLLYPTIKHIDVLDKDSSKLKPTTVEIDTNEIGIAKQAIDTTTNDEGTLMPLENSIEKKDIDKFEKINFSSFRENKHYFSTDLNKLFQYVPLVFPIKANCTNIMLIDKTVDQAHVFYDSANTDTLPVLFNRYTLRAELLELIKNNTTLNRVCIVATNANMYNNRKLFINDEPYFTLADLSSSNGYSKNVQLLIDLINQHSIKTIDFLACESLTYTAWQQYYNLLQGQGQCTIGASSDKTGNIAYGGDWIMESDNQNIQPVYFTSDIANYQTTLDVSKYNIVFGTYTPGGTTIQIPAGTTTYTVNDTQILSGSTVAIFNALLNTPVTIRLASITDTYYYNVEINSITGAAGNGSNVIIDGLGQTFQPGSDAVQFTKDAGANGFITLADANNALLGIEINNITVDTSDASNIYIADNVGWICGGNTVQANTVSFSECHISGAEFTIGYDIGNTYNDCGGICGGFNGSNGSANGGTYTFTNCSLASATGDITIGGGGNYNGGICGGSNGSGSGSDSVTTDGGTYIFTSCSLTSATAIAIGSGSYNGGICGGGNGRGSGSGSGSDSVTTHGGTYTFTNCSLTSATGGIAIGGGDNGGICGGGNGYGDGSGTVETSGGNYTFTNCSLISNGTGGIAIGGGDNGGICGGGNGLGYGYGSGSGSDSVTTHGGKYTFTNCSLTSATGGIAIGGNYNGGICGGFNGRGLGSGTVETSGGEYTFNNCSLTSATDITIGGGGVYNGGICGGGNGTIDGTTGKTYTFAQCTIIASTSISITETVVYTASTFNYVSDVASSQTNPTTIAPSTAVNNNALIFPSNTTDAIPTYTTSSLLIVAANMTAIFTQAYINTFAGYNLSGINLTGVNLSNYNLTNTILTGAILTGVIYNALTKITDSVAIATNIVNNSGTAISLGMYMPSASAMITYGMEALKYGLNSAGQQTQGMSLFVSGLFTALINSKTLGFTSTTEVMVPTGVLPTIITWATAPTSTVQLLNASIYPNTYNLPTYSQVKTFDLSSLRSTPVYFYVLVQNFPDTVTITNGAANTFSITAIKPYDVNPANVSFTCQIGAGTPFTVKAGSSTPIVFAGRNFYIGSASSTTAPIPTPTPIISNICFPSKTPIQTDQGIVSIYKLDTAYHTINGQPILHVTQTMTLDPYLICFEKDAIERNYPNKLTVMTKDHLIMFQGQLVPAYRFLDMSNKVKKVKYSGEVLYNVLLANHSLMNVNNLICETLHPNNAIAKLYMSNFSEAYKRNVVVVMNDALQNRDLPKYKSIINNALLSNSACGRVIKGATPL